MNSDLLKNIVKNGLVWATVGALFALLVPAVASMVGIPQDSVSVMAKPQWLAPFLGGTAAMATALEPVFSYIVGGNPNIADRTQMEPPPPHVLVVREHGLAPARETQWQDWHTERTATPPDPGSRLH